MSFHVARVYRILAAALSATHPLTPLLPQPFPLRDSRAPWPRHAGVGYDRTSGTHLPKQRIPNAR